MSMTKRSDISRREWLASAAAIAACAREIPSAAAASLKPIKPKSIAGVVTVYRERSHADVLIGKILEGWKQDGGNGPALKLASLYVEQKGDDDLSVELSRKYGFPIFDSIEKAVTVGSDRILVDGVISIGEHGNYPWNDKDQHLYPRRRFFKEISDTFVKYGHAVPVFSDKHLGPQWSDAKWMYDRAQELKIPFMAGSSMAVTFRQPEISIPLGSEIEAAVGIGYSGLDIYGAHTLDCFQSLVERRRGAEAGVKSVQCLQGESIWKRLEADPDRKGLFQAALNALPNPKGNPAEDSDSALYLFEYLDGFVGFVFMLSDTVSGISVALKIKGAETFLATHFEERHEPSFPHFAYLLKGIERMVHTGRPSYPVERVLLTSGILDRALTSRLQDYAKLQTPELAIKYQPVDYPHAPNPDLDSDPTELN